MNKELIKKGILFFYGYLTNLKKLTLICKICLFNCLEVKKQQIIELLKKKVEKGEM